MRYTARAPLRIDLGGTWTCLPAHAEAEGGVSLCAAITLYAEGSIAQPSGTGMLRSLRSDRRYLSYTVDVPEGAGLGASAAQTVLWVALVRSVVDNAAGRLEVARTSCEIDAKLGTLRGQQDSFASALGGISFLSVGHDVEPERLELAPSTRDALADRVVLLWSGRAGQSGAVAHALQERVRSGDRSAAEGLKALGQSAMEMRDALRGGDIDALAGLVEEQATRQRDIMPAAATEAARDAADLARRLGAIAARPAGISGGVVIALTRFGDQRPVAQALEARGVRVLEAGIDTYGVHLRKA